jgi:plastocyanin
MSKLNRRATLLGLAAAPLALATAAKAGAKHKVEISNMAFRPKELTIKAGDTVRWTNSDDMEHTATDKGRKWNTGGIGANRSKSITFDTPGTYDYFCKIHTNMKGRIIVE